MFHSCGDRLFKNELNVLLQNTFAEISRVTECIISTLALVSLDTIEKDIEWMQVKVKDVSRPLDLWKRSFVTTKTKQLWGEAFDYSFGVQRVIDLNRLMADIEIILVLSSKRLLVAQERRNMLFKVYHYILRSIFYRKIFRKSKMFSILRRLGALKSYCYFAELYYR